MKTDNSSQPKFLQLLSLLSNKERKFFARYLLMNFENEDFEVKLYSHISENERLDKNLAFKLLYPNNEYDDKKIRYLLTSLNDELEDFLIYRHLQNNPMMANNLLIRELVARNSEKPFYGIIISQNQIFEKSSTEKDTDYYLHQFLTEEGLLLAATQKFKRQLTSNIEDVINKLDKFYLVRKLQLCCEIFNVQNVLGTNYKVFLLEEISDYLSKNPLQDVPLVNIYFKILKTLTESENEQHFIDLKQLLSEFEPQFKTAELRDMYQYVMNYCIKKINLGYLNYQRELFEIYKKALENKVLLFNEKISQWDYKNIVTICMRLKELDWANEFINSYKIFLAESDRENAFKYNQAYLYFMRKEFSKTLLMLQKVDFTDIFYQLDTKAILLKTYFELDDDLAFNYHAKAFKLFLKRNKRISEYQTLIYSNLIRYSKDIFKSGRNIKKLNELKSTIQSKKQAADIQWLIEKIDERV